MVSPDQHWLVFREYYPPQADIDITEQYMLYDLTKDASGNRVSGVDYRYVNAPGRTIYPATPKHAPFESHRVLPEQVHSFASDSFFWSPDSKSVTFVDRSAAELHIVLVRIAAEDLTAYVHPVSASRVCGDANVDREQVAIPRMEVAPTQEAVPQVWVDLGASCGAKTLTLRSKDFSLAKIEVHPPHARRPSVGVKKQ
jgi:hypothetical protein